MTVRSPSEVYLLHTIFIPLAGLFSMDRLTAFGFMFSRPLAVAGIMGLLGGNAEWCILGGIFFELIGIVDLPVGTRIAKDDTFCAYAYSFIVTAENLSGLGLAFAAVTASFIFMFPVSETVEYIRKINKRLLKSGKFSPAALIFLGQSLSFLRGALVYPLCAGLSLFLYRGFSKVIPAEIPLTAALISFAALCGYFANFFNVRLLHKAMLLLLGGGVSWLIF